MKRRAAARTISERDGVVCSSSMTSTYTRPSKGCALVWTSSGTGRAAAGSGPLVGDVDAREELDRLRLAVLEDGEVLAREVPHRLSVAVGDDRVDLDVADLHREGDGGRVRSRRPAPAPAHGARSRS